MIQCMGPIHYKKNGWGFSSFLLVFLFFFFPFTNLHSPPLHVPQPKAQSTAPLPHAGPVPSSAPTEPESAQAVPLPHLGPTLPQAAGRALWLLPLPQPHCGRRGVVSPPATSTVTWPPRSCPHHRAQRLCSTSTQPGAGACVLVSQGDCGLSISKPPRLWCVGTNDLRCSWGGGPVSLEETCMFA